MDLNKALENKPKLERSINIRLSNETYDILKRNDINMNRFVNVCFEEMIKEKGLK